MQPWLVKSGHWIYSTDRTSVPSHVMLCGGKMKIPSDMRSAPDSPFLLSMAREIACSNPVHVVERTFARGTYRMFADLDVPREDPFEASEFLSELLERAVGDLPDELCVFPILICTRKWHDGKIGAHLIWNDDLRVNDEQAVELRDLWIEALGEEDKEIWEKTIDEAVYRRNGLRMPWALKKNGHPDAAYVPTHVVLEDSAIERIDPPVDSRDVREVAKWLSRASIHALEPEPGADSSTRKRKAIAAPISSQRSRNTKDSAHLTSGESFALTDEDARNLLEVLPRAYGIGDVSSIGTRCKKICGKTVSILVSARSRVCACAGREHSANHVFFELKSDGKIFQRCHSKDPKCDGKSIELTGIYHGLSEELFVDPNKHPNKPVANVKVSLKTPKDVASMASTLIAKMEEQRLWTKK